MLHRKETIGHFTIDNVGRPHDKRGIMTIDGKDAVVDLLGEGTFRVRFKIHPEFPHEEKQDFSPEAGTYVLEVDDA